MCIWRIGELAAARLVVTGLFLIVCGFLPARALDAIVVQADDNQVALGQVVELFNDAGPLLNLGTGTGEPEITVTATAENATPGWAVLAIKNDSAAPLTRWLVVQNTGSVESGLLFPVLAGPRLMSVTADGAPNPIQRSSGRVDIFEVDLPPGEVVTFVVETLGPGAGGFCAVAKGGL